MNLLASILAAVLSSVYAPGSDIPNLDTVKTEINAYYQSGHYQRDVAGVDAHLQSYVDARLKQGVRKPAVVFDIDDTMLSSYAYERAYNFAYTERTWSQWERTDRFPPIGPTLQLARHLAGEHVAVFYVTGRREPERAITQHELSVAGYPAPVALYLRPVSDRSTSVIPYKSRTRAAIEHQGYDILASIGDQWSDLRGGYADRLYKLPNPMYYLP
jgi:predicted secreted acid phosphatase